MLYQVMSVGIVLATTEPEPSSGLASLLPLLIIGGAVYFIFFGPQRRRAKAMRENMKEMRDSIEYGDDIVTVGGIYGRVTAVTDQDVTIDVGGGTELLLTRTAVAKRIGDDAE